MYFGRLPDQKGGVPATGVHFLLTFYYCVSGGSWFFGCHRDNPCPRVRATGYSSYCYFITIWEEAGFPRPLFSGRGK